ncbi:phage GP46 family protein [Shinella zoogloeoides]|uniref:phage GP46 family protein n=1 Tax=Shinella zoogloeoides TaxID=352475 RepID=UPI001F5AFDF9|nr:phage GP46 family protein [Shinella zoogloeoides]
MLRIIPLDESEEPYRAPDIGWDGVAGDLILNALDHPTAPGDLRAEQGLATQVLIHLMTDRRVEESELPEGEQNRGWFGDSFDLMDGEGPLGSRLWLLRRREIYEGIEIDVDDYVREALEPLIAQGAVASIDVAVTVDRPGNRVDYVVTLTGRDGARVYERKFELLWRQINGVVHPLAG